MPLRPDLTIRDLRLHPWLPPLPPLTGFITVSFTIINVSRVFSPEIDPGVCVNAITFSPPPGQNEIQIQKSRKLHALRPLTGQHFDVLFSVRELVAKRIRRIEVIADPKRLLPEADEYNNYASISVLLPLRRIPIPRPIPSRP